jgi:hypothetical protein
MGGPAETFHHELYHPTAANLRDQSDDFSFCTAGSGTSFLEMASKDDAFAVLLN